MARKPRDFGERVTAIEARLKRRGFNAEEIAHIFSSPKFPQGVSPRTIRRWRHRKTPPSEAGCMDCLEQAESFLDMISRADIPNRFGDRTFTQISDREVGLLRRPIFAFDIPSELPQEKAIFSAIAKGEASALDVTVNIIDPTSLASKNETFRINVDPDTQPSEIVSEFFDLFRQAYDGNQGASFAISSVLPIS